MDSAPPRPDRGDRIRRLVLLVLLALVAAVSVGRAVDLIRHGWRPTAPGERRWLEWASGNRWERAVRAALPERPPSVSGDGRELVVRVTAGGPVRPDWVQVMAQYRWPAHRVLAVEVVDGGRSGPPRDVLPATPELELRVSEPSPEPFPGRAGRPEGVSGSSFAAVAGILALAAILAAVLAWRPLARSIDPGALADAVAAAALALFVWKMAAAPLWSWDHYAIWGLKARRLAAVGLHPGWLAPPAFPYSAPDYPLGWPLALSSLACGRVAGAAVFKLAHLACGVGVTLLVRLAVLRSGGDRTAAGVAAALTAASPLLWDTESLGLADLPLALAAVAAAALVLGAGVRRKPLRWLFAGLLLGLLPWIKQEGWVLSALLLGTVAIVAVSDRRLRLPAYGATLGLSCGALWLLQPLFHARLTRPGTGFLAGDWIARVIDRLPELPAILTPMARHLLHPAWLGLWLLFAVALVAGVLRGRWHAVALGAVVPAQLGVYALVYLATYLDPVAHIDSSFLRIAAALAPLALVSAGMAAGGPRDDPNRFDA